MFLLLSSESSLCRPWQPVRHPSTLDLQPSWRSVLHGRKRNDAQAFGSDSHTDVQSEATKINVIHHSGTKHFLTTHFPSQNLGKDRLKNRKIYYGKKVKHCRLEITMLGLKLTKASINHFASFKAQKVLLDKFAVQFWVTFCIVSEEEFS